MVKDLVPGFLSIIIRQCIKFDTDWKKALYAYAPLRYCMHGKNERDV